MSPRSVTNFGAGCFIFAVSQCNSMADWFSEVETTLGKIAAIDDLTIVASGEDFQSGCALANYETLNIEDHAQPSVGEISFQITIPERLQRNPQGAIDDMQRRLAATIFRVHLTYQYYGPATFIECVNSALGNEALGATGVMIVRDYLRSEIARLNGRVTMHTVGPTPFHADFRVIVEDSPEPENAELVTISRQQGYDLCTFRFYDELSANDLCNVAFHFLEEELSVYYELARGSHINRLNLEKLDTSLESLIEFQQAQGFKAALTRLFQSSRRARNLLIKTIQVEAEVAARSRYSTEAIESITKYRNRVLFLEELRTEAAVTYLDELRTIREAASVLESGRSKDFEIAVVAASTLLGGIAGAIAALIAS